jgi:serine/threonine-protein kinase
VTGSEPHEPGAGAPDGEARDPGALPPGFAVGEYRIDRLLGRGGMGSVYAAHQPEIGARVAVKVLAAELSRDARLVQRFVDEARAVNKIRHPNIIDIFAFGRLPDGRHHFVMELLDGETLAARLERGPLPPSDARRLLLQICEALEAAHQEGVVHRDLKPENLWIATPRHGQPYAKLLDFGIAKLAEDRDASLATETGVAMGTAHFMAPEQCRGEPVDARTDIYALGVILYRMWAGRLPFEGGSFLAVVTQQITATPVPPSVHAPLPARLEALILRCLQKDPAARPQSARVLGAELGEILEEALPGETVPSAAGPDRGETGNGKWGTGNGERGTGNVGSDLPRPVRRERVRAPVRWRRVVVGVAIAAVVASVAAIVITQGPRPLEPRPPAAAAPTSIARPVERAPAAVAPASVSDAPPARPAPRVKQRRSDVAPAVERAPSRLEEGGYLKENPFR